MTLCPWIQNTIGQLRTVTEHSTRTLVITRHVYHRYIYLLVLAIFDVITCTITFLLKQTWFYRFTFSYGGSGHILIRWSSYQHLKHFRGVHSVCMLFEWPAARVFNCSFLVLLNFFLQNDWHLYKKCTLSGHSFLSHYFCHNLSLCQDLGSQFVRMKYIKLFYQ